MSCSVVSLRRSVRGSLALVLLDEIEAAAVQQPDVAVDVRVGAWPQVAVEPVEQERVADPHDAGHDVDPPRRETLLRYARSLMVEEAEVDPCGDAQTEPAVNQSLAAT